MAEELKELKEYKKKCQLKEKKTKKN